MFLLISSFLPFAALKIFCVIYYNNYYNTINHHDLQAPNWRVIKKAIFPFTYDWPLNPLMFVPSRIFSLPWYLQSWVV